MRTKREGAPDMVAVARRVRLAMTKIDQGIEALANESGTLLALMDNADDVQTLSSVRSDTGYQLVGNLADAYQQMANFLSGLAGDKT